MNFFSHFSFMGGFGNIKDGNYEKNKTSMSLSFGMFVKWKGNYKEKFKFLNFQKENFKFLKTLSFNIRQLKS